MTLADKLWEKYCDIDYTTLFMYKEGFTKALDEALQLQRKACFEEFFAYNMECKDLQKIGNIYEMRKRILNAKVKV